MKTFKCKQCGINTNYVLIRVQSQIAAKMDSEGNFWPTATDFELPFGRCISPNEVLSTNLDCEECTGTLELVEVDECLHVWRARYHTATLPPYRRCAICGIEQEGEMKWPV